MENLPDEQANRIFEAACGSLQLDSVALNEAPHFTLQDWLRAIKAGAKIDADRIENEIETLWNTGKRQPNIREKDVADTIAAIYVREVCSYPESRHSKGKPSTDFARAVNVVFKILGLTIESRNPSDRAVQEIVGKIDLEGAKHDLARRQLIRQALGIKVMKRKAGSALKSLIS